MRNKTIWGDGFADDRWAELARVRDWNLVAPDECVRLFPSLLPQSEEIPAPIIALIRARAAAISVACEETETQEQSTGCEFAEPPPAVVHRPKRIGTAQTTASDALFLRAVVTLSPLDRRRHDERDWARLAYLSSVHPAYVWRAAANLANWGASAAWLGALARCGSALMPIEVAEYFADAAEPGARGGVSIRDPLLAQLVERTARPADILHAAQRRLDGIPVVVRRRSGESGDERLLSPLRRSFGRLRLVLGHAAAARARAP